MTQPPDLSAETKPSLPRTPGLSALPPIVMVGGLMLFSAAMFGLMNATIRVAADHSGTFQNVFFRNLMAALVLLPWALWARHRWTGTQRWGRHLVRALVGTGGMYLFFWGAEVLPLANMVALTFTMPLFVLIGAALFLGEKVRLRRWLATLIGFIGVIIILQPGGDAFDVKSFIPLVAALFMAAAVMLVKTLSRTEDPIAMVFIQSCFASLFTLVPAILTWQRPDATAWWCYLVFGLTGVAAHVSLVNAFKRAEASLVIPFDYLRLPATAFCAYLFFGEVPTLWLWVGAAFIAGATLYITQREVHLARQQRSRQPAVLAKRERPL